MTQQESEMKRIVEVLATLEVKSEALSIGHLGSE